VRHSVSARLEKNVNPVAHILARTFPSLTAIRVSRAVTLRYMEKLRFDKHVGQNGITVACVIKPSLWKYILIVNRDLQVDGGSYIIIFRTQMSFYIYIYVYIYYKE